MSACFLFFALKLKTMWLGTFQTVRFTAFVPFTVETDPEEVSFPSATLWCPAWALQPSAAEE